MTGIQTTLNDKLTLSMTMPSKTCTVVLNYDCTIHEFVEACKALAMVATYGPETIAEGFGEAKNE